MPAISAHGNLRLFPEPRLDRLYEIQKIDAFEWLRARARNSIHAVVTDPPYGLLEYTEEQKQKLRAGKGGVWRIPPSFDRSEEHTSELQSRLHLVCRLLLEKKKKYM